MSFREDLEAGKVVEEYILNRIKENIPKQNLWKAILKNTI